MNAQNLSYRNAKIVKVKIELKTNWQLIDYVFVSAREMGVFSLQSALGKFI